MRKNGETKHMSRLWKAKNDNDIDFIVIYCEVMWSYYLKFKRSTGSDERQRIANVTSWNMCELICTLRIALYDVKAQQILQVNEIRDRKSRRRRERSWGVPFQLLWGLWSHPSWDNAAPWRLTWPSCRGFTHNNAACADDAVHATQGRRKCNAQKPKNRVIGNSQIFCERLLSNINTKKKSSTPSSYSKDPATQHLGWPSVRLWLEARGGKRRSWMRRMSGSQALKRRKISLPRWSTRCTTLLTSVKKVCFKHNYNIHA